MRVERPPADALRRQIAPTSAEVRERVVAARERQLHRLAGQPETCNAQLTSRQIREVGRDHAERAAPARRALRPPRAVARGHTRILRVARTVADLDGSDVVGPEHVNIAASLRLDDSHRSRRRHDAL